MQKCLSVLVVLLLLGAGCAPRAVAPDQIGASRFGRLVEGAVTESDIKGGWVRPHPGPFWWDQIEIEHDVYDWSEADRVVTYWQERDQALLATLWPFAQWDQARCHSNESTVKHPFGDEQVWLRNVCHNESFDEWVNAVVERYDGDGADDMPGLRYGITHWEIGNEPDLQTSELSFFQSGPSAYAEVYRLAYAQIKQADPDATLLFGGMAAMHQFGRAFWEEVFTSERERVEVFNIHSLGASDQFYAKEYHEFLVQNGFLQPSFWITEALVGSRFFQWDEQQKARMTLVGYAQAFANGAARVFDVGRHDPSGGPGDLAEQTFARVVELMDGFEKAEWIGQNSLIKFTFSDRVIFVAWDGVKLPLSVSGRVQTVRYDGVRKQMDAREVRADEPMFVIVP